MRQIKNRLDKRIESFPRNVILVKEIAAMNKEIDLIIQSVLHNGQKIFKNGIGPAFAASRVTLKKLGNLISEMGISRVDELQRDLQNLMVLTHRETIMPGRARLVSKRVSIVLVLGPPCQKYFSPLFTKSVDRRLESIRKRMGKQGMGFLPLGPIHYKTGINRSKN